jgi:hypothetical protein
LGQIIGKEPEYRRKQQEAAKYRGQTKQHEDNIRAIASLSEKIEDVTAQQQVDRDQREYRETKKETRDWITIGVIASTAVVALGTLLVTHRDTSNVIAEAQRASKQQHEDTMAALGKTDTAISETTQLANETKRAADIAQQNLILSRRPWLDFAGDIEIKEPLTIRKDGEVEVTLKTSAKNTGQSPALGVEFNAELHFDIPPVFHINEIIDKYLCLLTKFNINFMGTPSAQIIMPHDTIDLSPVQSKNVLNQRADPFISVCIYYSDEFGGAHGIGEILYYSADNSRPIMLPVAGEIPGRLLDMSGKVVK